MLTTCQLAKRIFVQSRRKTHPDTLQTFGKEENIEELPMKF